MSISIDQALEWVKRRWREPLECEACGENEWGLAELLAIPVSHFDKPVLAAHMPVYPLVCSTCGNTKFLSARIVRERLADEGKNPEQAA